MRSRAGRRWGTVVMRRKLTDRSVYYKRSAAPSPWVAQICLIDFCEEEVPDAHFWDVNVEEQAANMNDLHYLCSDQRMVAALCVTVR